MTAALEVRSLRVGYATSRGTLHALDGFDLTIAPGEIHGIVGESGSGKSTLAYAVVRYLAGNARIEGGSIAIAGADVMALDDEALRRLRGRTVGMVYQDPATALNPAMRLGDQVAEVLRWHENAGAEANARTLALLRQVKLPDPELIAAKFPHEVSGGEKQRVLIAMAIACRPALMILDEPTTALDATTAAAILDLLRGLRDDTGMAALYITHDLGIVRQIADKVSVVYAGRVVETGGVADVLGAPGHPYTRALHASIPNPHRMQRRARLANLAGGAPDLHRRLAGCAFQDRCPHVGPPCRAGEVDLAGNTSHRVACVRRDTIADAPPPAQDGGPGSPARTRGDAPPALGLRGLSVIYRRPSWLDRLRGRRPVEVRALTDVDLDLAPGETLGLVGESGCGKSTLARAAVGLLARGGTIARDGEAVDWTDRAAVARYRRDVQIVFQHPDLALNPRMTVGAALQRPLKLAGRLAEGRADALVGELLDMVRLPADIARRYPHELSGGQKQRVCIARAFAARPRVVICDEITSGLDVSVQAAIMNLLLDLQDRFGVAYLFISHDLNLVQHVADRIAVMYLGRVVEIRGGAGVLRPPYHPYTEALLSSAPVPDPDLSSRTIRLDGTPPSPAAPPAGCAFHTRCRHRIAGTCERVPPPVRDFGGGRWAACHLDAAALAAMAPVWQTRQAD